jgi:hypothetical protein
MERRIGIMFLFAFIIGCSGTNPIAIDTHDVNALGVCALKVNDGVYNTFYDITCSQCDSIALWKVNNTIPTPSVKAVFTAYDKTYTH